MNNMKHVDLLHTNGTNVYDIMNHDKVYVTDSALDSIEKRFVNDK